MGRTAEMEETKIHREQSNEPDFFFFFYTRIEAINSVDYLLFGVDENRHPINNSEIL